MIIMVCCTGELTTRPFNLGNSMKKPHLDMLQEPVDWSVFPEDMPMIEGERDAQLSGFRFVAPRPINGCL